MIEFLSNMTWIGWTVVTVVYLFIGMTCAFIQLFSVEGTPSVFDMVIVSLTFVFWPLWLVVRVFLFTIVVLCILAAMLAATITGNL